MSPQPATSNQVLVSADAFGQMTLCAVRYALGRATYVVGDVTDFVRAYWERIPERWQQMIVRDLADDIRQAEQAGRFLGHPNDHERWRNLLAWTAQQPSGVRSDLQIQVENDRFRTALELIACSKRSDGTYNRSREACEHLARVALGEKV